jgi:hypothetical protein
MRTVGVDPVEAWLGDRCSFVEYSPRTGGRERLFRFHCRRLGR